MPPNKIAASLSTRPSEGFADVIEKMAAGLRPDVDLLLNTSAEAAWIEARQNAVIDLLHAAQSLRNVIAADALNGVVEMPSPIVTVPHDKVLEAETMALKLAFMVLLGNMAQTTPSMRPLIEKMANEAAFSASLATRPGISAADLPGFRSYMAQAVSGIFRNALTPKSITPDTPGVSN